MNCKTYYSVVRYTIVNRSHRMCHEDRGLSVKMNLCASEIKEYEHGVGTDVNVIVMSDVLLNGIVYYK